jgi:hypothetical protein
MHGQQNLKSKVCKLVCCHDAKSHSRQHHSPGRFLLMPSLMPQHIIGCILSHHKEDLMHFSNIFTSPT